MFSALSSTIRIFANSLPSAFQHYLGRARFKSNRPHLRCPWGPCSNAWRCAAGSAVPRPDRNRYRRASLARRRSAASRRTDPLSRGARAGPHRRVRRAWRRPRTARTGATRARRRTAMKTILITGATAGFGEAAARRFVGGGWNAIGTGRRGDRLKRLQEELGDAFLPLEVDMRDLDAVGSLGRLDAPWGEIDLLLNNAGLAPPTDPLPDTDWERIDDVIDTNIT